MTLFWFLIGGMTLLALSFWVIPLLRAAKITVLGYLSIFLGILLFSALAIGLYLHWGAHAPLSVYLAETQKNTLLEAEIKKLGSLQNIILTLEKRVKAHPDSQGWMLLGRLYLKNQAFTQAVEAFAQANQLAPHQPEILVSYAESLYFAHHFVLTQQAKQLLTEVLQQVPNQPDALHLLAIAAYKQGAVQTAIAYWQRLASALLEGSQEKQAVLQMIAEASEKKGHTAAIQLLVQVEITAALQKKLQGEETLFIYAQAVKGPTMPLAIVRKQARDLPVEVTLDQAMFMLPNATLADYPQIKIIARISKSGQAVPTKGDIVGSSPVIDMQHRPDKIRILIDKQV